jgi:formimidoylglutamate deiminase
MTAYFTPHALLPTGWARDVRLVVEGGAFTQVIAGSSPAGATTLGPVLPGMANLHSHAFQRAMAGLTDVGSTNGDFWTWRQLMYRFVERLTPAQAEAIARQLYIEMLKAGYTAVAEFHYVHADDMLTRHLAAATDTGIAITLMPSLYRWSGFGEKALTPRQSRFRTQVDDIIARVNELRRHASADVHVGVAPHSLRAVDPGALKELIAGVPPGTPIHIHAAEQTREVDECLAALARRPVEWLLENHAVDGRWCVVHATHMTAEETRALAASGATAGLCPTTEASLGDGIFPLLAYRAAGGSYGIGGDSHVCRDPAEELRLLEYVQRLVSRRRNLVVSDVSPAVGTTLWLEAAAGGAKALGRDMGAIAPGKRADLVVVDGGAGDAIANALMFSGTPGLVRDVMVAGAWRVQGGRHAAEDSASTAYRRALAALLAP